MKKAILSLVIIALPCATVFASNFVIRESSRLEICKEALSQVHPRSHANTISSKDSIYCVKNGSFVVNEAEKEDENTWTVDFTFTGQVSKYSSVFECNGWYSTAFGETTISEINCRTIKNGDVL